MTNQEKFIQTFGIEAWQKYIVATGNADTNIDFWTRKYESEVNKQ